ncbi:F-box only protein 2-like isoform 2-T2 [Leptodactylus fuscus]|uniref:F-box only protein 2-like isoform X2 n=1 Tax=Leptodactylus fuscus TaxID=238119 RepID=UPI003F4EF2F3
MARNLIKNPCGEEELEHWEDVQHGGDGWKVEELPGDCGAEFPSDGISKYFATSFEYAARTDAGCSYELTVQLLSDSQDVINEYKSENITIPEKTEGTWNQLSHTFSEYGPGVRFIQFTHGGQDSVYWKGWYGVRMTNSSITIEA